jgi:hypothetical protein
MQPPTPDLSLVSSKRAETTEQTLNPAWRLFLQEVRALARTAGIAPIAIQPSEINESRAEADHAT